MKLLRNFEICDGDSIGKVEVFSEPNKNSKVIVMSPIKGAFSANREEHFETAKRKLGIWFSGLHRWFFDFRLDSVEFDGLFKVNISEYTIFEYEKVDGRFRSKQESSLIKRDHFWGLMNLEDPALKDLEKIQEKYTRDENAFEILSDLSRYDFNKNRTLLKLWKDGKKSWQGGACDSSMFIKQVSPSIRIYKASGISAIINLIESCLVSLKADEELRFALLPDFIGNYEEYS